MRVAGLLLALVLVTSCFVGGTFAKYVTSGGGTDHARVAKFGVTVKATGNDTMFATQYDKAEGAPAALKHSTVWLAATLLRLWLPVPRMTIA